MRAPLSTWEGSPQPRVTQQGKGCPSLSLWDDYGLGVTHRMGKVICTDLPSTSPPSPSAQELLRTSRHPLSQLSSLWGWAQRNEPCPTSTAALAAPLTAPSPGLRSSQSLFGAILHFGAAPLCRQGLLQLSRELSPARSRVLPPA